MMLNLIKKEFRLCLHATNIIFLACCLFVFIPNYPYEVGFFFCTLSAFFVCITARENGDASFSCTLPVNKRDVAVARVLFIAFFQCALLLLMGVTVAIKECLFPVQAQVNMGGVYANLAFLGNGGFVLGTFNLIFFPWYFKNPNKVGIPFLVGAVVEFVLISLFLVLRFASPVFGAIYATLDPENMGAKAAVFSAGLIFFFAATFISCLWSGKRFEKTDL